MTWAVVDWSRVKTREQLLAARAKQLERREKNLEVAVERLKQNRLANRRFFWTPGRKRQGTLEVEAPGARTQINIVPDVVLLYHSRLDKQWSKKLDNRWLGP